MHDLTIYWHTLSNVIQGSTKLRSIFDGDPILIYNSLSNLTQEKSTVTLQALLPDQQKLAFSVEVDPKNVKEGHLVNLITARNQIDLLDESALLDKKVRGDLIRLATSYGLASNYTSFVCTIPTPIPKIIRLNSMTCISDLEEPKQVPSMQLNVPNPLNIKPFPSKQKKIYSQEFIISFRDVRKNSKLFHCLFLSF